MAIGRAVVYHEQSAARLVQELNVGTASVLAAAIPHGQFCNRARGRVLCTAYHLVQKLDVGTAVHSTSSRSSSSSSS